MPALASRLGGAASPARSPRGISSLRAPAGGGRAPSRAAPDRMDRSRVGRETGRVAAPVVQHCLMAAPSGRASPDPRRNPEGRPCEEAPCRSIRLVPMTNRGETGRRPRRPPRSRTGNGARSRASMTSGPSRRTRSSASASRWRRCPTRRRSWPPRPRRSTASSCRSRTSRSRRSPRPRPRHLRPPRAAEGRSWRSPGSCSSRRQRPRCSC